MRTGTQTVNRLHGLLAKLVPAGLSLGNLIAMVDTEELPVSEWDRISPSTLAGRS